MDNFGLITKANEIQIGNRKEYPGEKGYPRWLTTLRSSRITRTVPLQSPILHTRVIRCWLAPRPPTIPAVAPAATPRHPVGRSSSIRYREIPRIPRPSQKQTTSTLMLRSEEHT